MRKWFPEMYDRPDNGPVVASAIYWIICYFFIPFVTLVLSWAFSSDLTAVSGVDIATYIVNFLCMVSLFRQYLADSFWNVQHDKANVIKTVLIATVTILLIEAGVMICGILMYWDASLWSYPISETSVVATTCFVVISNPLFGTLCMTLLTPVTVSCMFYGTVFAPIANKKPWLGYIITAILLLLPRLLSTWWLKTGTYDVMVYLLQLPVHLIACWSYQKTNTIWTPIISLGITNLLISLFTWLLSLAGFIIIS